jgi:hypothetical protein
MALQEWMPFAALVVMTLSLATAATTSLMEVRETTGFLVALATTSSTVAVESIGSTGEPGQIFARRPRSSAPQAANLWQNFLR